MSEIGEPHIGLGDIVHSARSDYAESEHKLGLVSTTALALGIEAVNFAKIPLVTIPSFALEALHYTNSSTASGLVTGAVFGAWTYLSSGIINAAGDYYPKTKGVVRQGYPKAVGVLSESLPGLHIEEAPQARPTLTRRLRHSTGTHLERGIAAVGIGASVYIGAAQLDEKTKPEISRLRRVLSTDAALFIGSISCASAAVVAEIGNAHPKFAEFIQKWATDPKLLLGLALGVVATKGVKIVRGIRKTSVLVPAQEQDV